MRPLRCLQRPTAARGARRPCAPSARSSGPGCACYWLALPLMLAAEAVCRWLRAVRARLRLLALGQLPPPAWPGLGERVRGRRCWLVALELLARAGSAARLARWLVLAAPPWRICSAPAPAGARPLRRRTVLRLPCELGLTGTGLAGLLATAGHPVAVRSAGPAANRSRCCDVLLRQLLQLLAQLLGLAPQLLLLPALLLGESGSGARPRAPSARRARQLAQAQRSRSSVLVHPPRCCCDGCARSRTGSWRDPVPAPPSSPSTSRPACEPPPPPPPPLVLRHLDLAEGGLGAQQVLQRQLLVLAPPAASFMLAMFFAAPGPWLWRPLPGSARTAGHVRILAGERARLARFTSVRACCASVVCTSESIRALSLVRSASRWPSSSWSRCGSRWPAALPSGGARCRHLPRRRRRRPPPPPPACACV